MLPLPAIVPILLYIGLLIGAQAFQATPEAHAPAVVLAIIPNIAAWATGLIDNALAAAGTHARREVGDGRARQSAGVVYDGLKLLGGGAILAGLVLGAIVAFIIDKKFISAADRTASSARRSRFVGLIHAEQVGWNVGGQVALGYALAGIILLVFAFATAARRSGDGRRRSRRRRPRRAVGANRPPRTPRSRSAPVDTTRPGHRVSGDRDRRRRARPARGGRRGAAPRSTGTSGRWSTATSPC